MTTQEILTQAAVARRVMAVADTNQKNRALAAMGEALLAHIPKILAANGADLEAARSSIGNVMLDRLALNEGRIQAMAEGMAQVAKLPDPVGRLLSQVERPNGLCIRKVSVPMGTVAIIYESRPNVTADAAALCIKSGNACVLRGGKEAYGSNQAIVDALQAGLAAAGLPKAAVSLIQDTSRDSAQALMRANGLVDLLIPRGGASNRRPSRASRQAPASAISMWMRQRTRKWPWISWKMPRPAGPPYAMRRRYAWYTGLWRQPFCRLCSSGLSRPGSRRARSLWSCACAPLRRP